MIGIPLFRKWVIKGQNDIRNGVPLPRRLKARVPGYARATVHSDEQTTMDFERQCATELGEGIRPDHWQGYEFDVTDPTKRGPVPPPPDPLLEFLKMLTNRPHLSYPPGQHLYLPGGDSYVDPAGF